ncbi:MAG TPA: RNA-binding S4 domain-containing protein [Pirellulaceae bacterium]|nr:RNA-binding S4 domain-containing protein [Pirellulaceae bacterium]
MTSSDSEPAKEKLCLDQFLKLSGAVATGGQAKLMIQGGEVKVNGILETRRRRQLQIGDLIEVGGQRWAVTAAE